MWPPKHEPLVVAEIAAGHLSPADGVLWTIFPDRMRENVSVRVSA